MAQTNLLKLDRVQNKAMRVILGTTKDTPIEITRFMQDLPLLQTRQKVKQVKSYFSAVENPHHPLHEAMKDTKGCRLGRGKSWMSQAEDSILQVCQAEDSILQVCQAEDSILQVCQLTSQANQGVGKVPRPIPASLRDSRSCQKTWKSSIENVQQAKQSQ